MKAEQDYLAVLQTVSGWPSGDRLRLAQVILNSLSADSGTTRPGVAASQVLGLAEGKGPAPDDATFKKWIDEHRREKYG